ncbi:hypothetical protein, variant [Puccinia triticina 1-1 BBBD Race 1]|uniref:Uncharacterized protein n=1 Tax=Puccinia triticina (isolate 1-1 / race 1 (BBBD)) TaxID=630390 RepID=A0A180GQQ4_PUCT1|nr:hypothetical protein, variant [Puccinia triticina 1-1 BBBD Race 1]
MEFDDEDEDFFNDPALHAQLDQVENQFRLTQTQNQHEHEHEPEPPAKKPRLQSAATRNTNNQDEQNELNRLKRQIEQIRTALQQSDREKLRLKGQVSIIKSQLESTKSTTGQQLNELKTLEQQLKTRAERAEHQLARIESQRNLKDTFKGLEESAKKPAQPSASSLHRRTVLSSTPNPSSPSRNIHKDPNNRKLASLQQSFTPQPLPHPRSSFNPNDQSTQPPQNSSNQHPPRPAPRPSISFIDPPASSPFTVHEPPPSPPHSTSQAAAATGGPPAKHPYELIHSVIVRLFQSFVVSLGDPSIPTKGPGELPRAPVAPTLQHILNASRQLAPGYPTLKPVFDALVIDLFSALASASDLDTVTAPSSRPSNTLLSLHSTHCSFLPSSANNDDSRVLTFVVRLGSLFVQISSLLSRTDLIESQTHTVHILVTLAQASPLFGAFFLNHPDFEAYRDPHRVPHRPQEPDLLAVMLVLFDGLDRLRTPRDMPSPSSSADPASQPGLPALSQIKKDAPGAATGLSSPRPFNPCRLHTALLDLLAALAWDPPEPCYPTLERFFKSHGPSVFQFLLVGPHYPQHQAGAGSKEEQDDDLILTEKSIDVLLSLTSKTEFSKIILEARVHDSTGPTPSQPNPTSSTSNARQQQPQRAKSVGSTNSPANHRRSTAAAPPVDPPKTAEQRSEGSGSGMTVVDRLLKVFLLAATNLPGATADDPDRHGLKVKILCLLHLLAINHHRQHQPSADDLAGAEWTGWKALESAGSCLFSVLLKTIFVDSYRLWNVDGAVGHRQLVPRYVERITLSVQIIHKSVFPQSSSSSCSSPRTPLNLVHRIKQESPVFLSTLSSLPSAFFSSSSPSAALR